MSSTFGTLFRVTTFGESHGSDVGVVIDGCPPGLGLTEAAIQAQLDRRRPGQSALTSRRDEADRVVIRSGVESGATLGTPIALTVANEDARPADYAELNDIPRPSHADFTYRAKYGVAARSGGGRASARETIGRVAAGAVAEAVLRERYGIEIVAWVDAVGAETLGQGQVDAASERKPHAGVRTEVVWGEGHSPHSVTFPLPARAGWPCGPRAGSPPRRRSPKSRRPRPRL